MPVVTMPASMLRVGDMVGTEIVTDVSSAWQQRSVQVSLRTQGDLSTAATVRSINRNQMIRVTRGEAEVIPPQRLIPGMPAR